VSIRPGRAEDVAAVLPLVAKTIAFHEQLDELRFGAVPNAHLRYEGWFKRLLEGGEGVFLVAEEGGAIVGFLMGAVQQEYGMYRTGRYGMIHDLWVEPDQRRKGLGRGMVTAALDYFREQGLKQARLDSAFKNKAAQALFASCGFRPSVTEMLAEL
jgi:ribosomal protein S18 acetylase RimI-like enzyme